MTKKIYIVLNRCLGCQECERSCSKSHGYDIPRNYLVTVNNFFPIPLRCAHCEDPSCLAVCDHDAIHKTEEGAVLIDEVKCVGCGNCALACPYGMITLDLDNKRAVKCDLCPDLTSKGQMPACVANCALEALYYGEKDELEATLGSEFTKKLVTTSDLLREVIVVKEG